MNIQALKQTTLANVAKVVKLLGPAHMQAIELALASRPYDGKTGEYYDIAKMGSVLEHVSKLRAGLEPEQVRCVNALLNMITSDFRSYIAETPDLKLKQAAAIAIARMRWNIFLNNTKTPKSIILEGIELDVKNGSGLQFEKKSTFLDRHEYYKISDGGNHFATYDPSKKEVKIEKGATVEQVQTIAALLSNQNYTVNDNSRINLEKQTTAAKKAMDDSAKAAGKKRKVKSKEKLKIIRAHDKLVSDYVLAATMQDLVCPQSQALDSALFAASTEILVFFENTLSTDTLANAEAHWQSATSDFVGLRASLSDDELNAEFTDEILKGVSHDDERFEQKQEPVARQITVKAGVDNCDIRINAIDGDMNVVLRRMQNMGFRVTQDTDNSWSIWADNKRKVGHLVGNESATVIYFDAKSYGTDTIIEDLYRINIGLGDMRAALSLDEDDYVASLKTKVENHFSSLPEDLKDEFAHKLLLKGAEELRSGLADLKSKMNDRREKDPTLQTGVFTHKSEVVTKVCVSQNDAKADFKQLQSALAREGLTIKRNKGTRFARLRGLFSKKQPKTFDIEHLGVHLGTISLTTNSLSMAINDGPMDLEGNSAIYRLACHLGGTDNAMRASIEARAAQLIKDLTTNLDKIHSPTDISSTQVTKLRHITLEAAQHLYLMQSLQSAGEKSGYLYKSMQHDFANAFSLGMCLEKASSVLELRSAISAQAKVVPEAKPALANMFQRETANTTVKEFPHNPRMAASMKRCPSLNSERPKRGH